jgi:hypothetical protein
MVEEGNLMNTERALLMAHLNGCSACRGNLEHRRQLDARLRDVFAGLDTGPGFTARLLALIPKREAGISSAWRRPSVRVSGTQRAAPDGTRARGASVWTGRTLALPLVAAAALLVVVAAWWFLRASPVTATPPLVADQTENLMVERDGKVLALTRGMALQAGDELTVKPQPEADMGTSELSAETQPFCSIRLLSGARLLVRARGRYELRQGEAYFDVNPDRPGKDRSFNVETFCGQVQVVGTSFGIIVPSSQAVRVTVVVDKGKVLLKPLSGQSQTVSAGNECDLKKDGGTGTPLPILANRMPRLRSLDMVAENPTAVNRTETHPDQAAVKPLPGHVDWNTAVDNLDFSGSSLSKALQDLQKRMGPTAEWPLLIEEASKLAPEGTSSLIVRRPLSADTVVRWLAREQDLRFTPPSTLRMATGTEPPGVAENGELPSALATQLDTEMDLPDAELPGGQMLRLLAERTGFAVLVDAHANLPRVQRHTTWRAALEQLASSSDTDWAWYDGILYLAPRRQIETLTMVPRSEPLENWLGPRPLPVWERSLKQILSGLSVDREGHLTLNADRPVLSAVALYPDDRGIQFTTGIRGARIVSTLRALLQEGSVSVADPVAVLNELEASGPYRELGDLIVPSARRANVIYEGERREFPMQSFMVRRMPLGRALDAAARLHGLGLRIEPGRIVVGGYATCYGGPVLNSVLLASSARRCPRVALQLPETLARQAQACFPERLRGVEWLPLRDALIFRGDRSQLAAVQNVAAEMELAIAAAPDTFDPQTWQPHWRQELEENLKEPFLGDGSGTLPAGSFVGLLRGSGLFIPLKAEVLVDPAAMKELAARPLPALNVRGMTIGQALNTLAKTAGLRVIIEDGVIWLRP